MILLRGRGGGKNVGIMKSCMFCVIVSVETRYNKIIGTKKFCLLYKIFCYINKQYKTKQITLLGPEKSFVISDILLYLISLYRVSTVYT